VCRLGTAIAAHRDVLIAASISAVRAHAQGEGLYPVREKTVSMDSKRPDVQLGEHPDEDGRVSRFPSRTDSDRSLLQRLIERWKR